MCQSNYKPVISSIQLIGNTRTQGFILEREIHHNVNISLDSTMAIADRNRLENLGIFSEVAWKVVPLEDGSAILVFNVIFVYYSFLHVLMCFYKLFRILICT